MRLLVLAVIAAACGKDGKDAPRREPTVRDDAPQASVPLDAAPPLEVETYPNLATALTATIPHDARVIGFGELHMRTDRAQVRSTLARFTQDALPALVERTSDLIVETWVPDPKCGQKAKTATAKVEITVRRPAETKSEIALLAEAARAAKVQPHAMKLACEDYDKIAPQHDDVAAEEVLSLTTRELARIVGEAVRFRDKQGDKRPWIALYGGALHNDRFPAAGVEEWSYAKVADEVSQERFVEIDLIVPELAAANATLRTQPWYPLVERADDKVHVWQRGTRSYVVVLPVGQ